MWIIRRQERRRRRRKGRSRSGAKNGSADHAGGGKLVSFSGKLVKNFDPELKKLVFPHAAPQET